MEHEKDLELELVDLGDAATETKQPPLVGFDNPRDNGAIGF